MRMNTDESTVYEKLMEAAIHFVSYRPRSEKEFRDFLINKLAKSHTTAPLVLTKVIERMKDLGYIDDYAFSSWWVGQRTGSKPKGERVIALELSRKGISREVIAEIIGQIMKGERSEKVLARLAAEKKLPGWSHLPHVKKKQKLAEYLLRRGFASDTVWGIVDDLSALG